MTVTGSFSLSSCEDSVKDSPKQQPQEPQEPEYTGPKESTILIYAVSTNNLGPNLETDKKEMLTASSNFDLNRHNVILFETSFENIYNYSSPSHLRIYKMAGKGSNVAWEELKEFPEGTAALDPNTISEVIDYVVTEYDTPTKGLIFWSHSSGAQPYQPSRSEAQEKPQSYSFGQDLIHSYGDDFYMINVNDLADAIPEGVFNFIWFDSCYMGNIESAYQFRNKCDYYVSYPTEVCDEGMPYQRTLSYLTSSTPDLLGAAQEFFDFYDNEYRWRLATISILDMSKMEEFAEFCKDIYNKVSVTTVSSMICYTRSGNGPFYDLGDYSKKVASLSGYDLSDEEWNSYLDKLVVYKKATPYGFNNQPIYPERYSGLSTHIYQFGENLSQDELFYQSLDWGRKVFGE